MFQESRGKGVYSFLFFLFFIRNLVTSMMELLDSLVILQVECQKYFFNKHQIIFEIKMPDQFFKTPIGKLILVKVLNRVYEIT
jgi:hypothetical protein